MFDINLHQGRAKEHKLKTNLFSDLTFNTPQCLIATHRNPLECLHDTLSHAIYARLGSVKAIKLLLASD